MQDLPPEVAEEAKRRLTAARALDMRNNRFGAASAYIAWALDVLIGLDPLDSVHSLMDGATLESLLVGHLPIAEEDLARLRTEVREMYARLAATADASQRKVDAVKNMGTALSLIEQTLLPG